MRGPNKTKIHPNSKVPSVCLIKNIVKNPNIIIGDYTHCDDYENNGEDFEKHVTHFYPFIGDKLIIGSNQFSLNSNHSLSFFKIVII